MFRTTRLSSHFDQDLSFWSEAAPNSSQSRGPKIDQMPRLRQILKGVKVERGKEGKASRPRMPITPTILRKIKVIWLNGGNSFNLVMLWAAALVTFFSFCRSGEVTVEDETKYDVNTLRM